MIEHASGSMDDQVSIGWYLQSVKKMTKNRQKEALPLGVEPSSQPRFEVMMTSQ